MFKVTKKKSLRGIVFPDLHFPIHDKKAYHLVMEFTRWLKPDFFVNLGDLGHFSGISHWNKKKYQIRKDYPIKRDLDLCYNHHKALREINKDADIFTLGGNHESWMDQWLVDHPEMDKYIDENGNEQEGYFDFRRDMGIKEFGVDYIPSEKQPTKIGKLRLLHGWFLGIHHAKKHSEHIHHSTLYGHAHDVQSHTPNNIDPRHRYISWCLGHLSDEKKADYMKNRPSNWMLCFGVLEIEPDRGSFTVHPIPIPTYEFCWNGTHWSCR